jgi:hypothetical protein
MIVSVVMYPSAAAGQAVAGSGRPGLLSMGWPPARLKARAPPVTGDPPADGVHHHAVGWHHAEVVVPTGAARPCLAAACVTSGHAAPASALAIAPGSMLADLLIGTGVSCPRLDTPGLGSPLGAGVFDGDEPADRAAVGNRAVAARQGRMSGFTKRAD